MQVDLPQSGGVQRECLRMKASESSAVQCERHCPSGVSLESHREVWGCSRREVCFEEVTPCVDWAFCVHQHHRERVGKREVSDWWRLVVGIAVQPRSGVHLRGTHWQHRCWPREQSLPLEQQQCVGL